MDIKFVESSKFIKRCQPAKFSVGEKLKVKLNQDIIDKKGNQRNYLNAEIVCYKFNEAYGIHMYGVCVEGSNHDVFMDEKTLIKMVGEK